MTTFEVSVGAVSDVGLARDRNEDTVGVAGWTCSAFAIPPQEFLLGGEEVCLLTVADGLGGHPHGDVASRLVVQSLADNRSEMTNEDGIRREIRAANEILHAEMLLAPDRARMGTTIAGLAITASKLFVFNVGDSRVFEYLGGYLIERSESDGLETSDGIGPPNTFVGATLGGVTELESGLEPHLWTDDWAGSRRFILCSDGLANFASIDQMESVLQSTTEDGKAAERLLELAFTRDAPDNVSIIVATTRTNAG